MSDKYQKLSVIGSGTFGRVWLVRHTQTGRKYVLKEVAVSRLEERERRQALTEVTVLARCRHVNIVKYREAYLDDGVLNIAMAYAEGGKVTIVCLPVQLLRTLVNRAYRRNISTTPMTGETRGNFLVRRPIENRHKLSVVSI